MFSVHPRRNSAYQGIAGPAGDDLVVHVSIQYFAQVVPRCSGSEIRAFSNRKASTKHAFAVEHGVARGTQLRIKGLCRVTLTD